MSPQPKLRLGCGWHLAVCGVTAMTIIEVSIVLTHATGILYQCTLSWLRTFSRSICCGCVRQRQIQHNCMVGGQWTHSQDQDGLTHWGRDKMAAIFQCIFMNENIWIFIKISLKFVPKGPINNIPALFQIMAWHQSGEKPLSEPRLA